MQLTENDLLDAFGYFQDIINSESFWNQSYKVHRTTLEALGTVYMSAKIPDERVVDAYVIFQALVRQYVDREQFVHLKGPLS